MTAPPVVPIVVTLYRRPEATRRLLTAIDEAFGSRKLPLLISCDGPKRPPHHVGCYQTRQVAEDFVQTRQFACTGSPTILVENVKNIGIDLHKIQAIEAAFTEWPNASGVILLEDDTRPAKDALNYFCTQLAESSSSTLAVCGYNRQGTEADFDRIARHDPYGIWHSTFVPWGWAMTRAKWNEIFGGNAETYRKETGDGANGLFDHWFVTKGWTCVRPVCARTNHGEWDMAEHTPSQEWWQANEESQYGAWNLDLPDTGILGWGKNADPFA